MLISKSFLAFFFTFVSSIPIVASTLELSVTNLATNAIWKAEGVGSLSLQGGWTLSSADKTFGGLSALELFEGDLISVSDRGYLANLGPLDELRNLNFTSKKTINWKLTPVDTSALRNRGPATDAESLAVDKHGNLLIAFEREHRIQIHTNLSAAPYSWEVPIALRRPAPLNFGVEAMTRLEDGRIFAVSERVKRDGGFRAYLIDGDRGEDRELMVYIPEDDWLPSGATTLPNGDVLLLERRVSVGLLGFRSRLLLLKKGDLFEGARLKPKVLFTFPFASVGADNMEGIISLPNSNGSIELWIVTDDNFNLFQRTHLLRFNLSLDSGL